MSRQGFVATAQLVAGGRFAFSIFQDGMKPPTSNNCHFFDGGWIRYVVMENPWNLLVERSV